MKAWCSFLNGWIFMCANPVEKWNEEIWRKSYWLSWTKALSIQRLSPHSGIHLEPVGYDEPWRFQFNAYHHTVALIETAGLLRTKRYSCSAGEWATNFIKLVKNNDTTYFSTWYFGFIQKWYSSESSNNGQNKNRTLSFSWSTENYTFFLLKIHEHLKKLQNSTILDRAEISSQSRFQMT